MSSLWHAIDAVAASTCSLSFRRNDFTPTNAALSNNPDLLSYLRRISRSRWGKDLIRFLDEHYRVTGLSMNEIQYICNILGYNQRLLSELTLYLPPNGSVKLSDDFESTHLILFVKNEKVIHRRAAFGLIDAEASNEQLRDADRRILGLLRGALGDDGLEEAVVTLQGGDARRALLHMQQLVDSETHWMNFVRSRPEGEQCKFGGTLWRRMHNLLAKLAAFSDQIPVPLEVDDLRRGPTPVCVSQFADIYAAECQNTQVALKRLRTFASLAEPERREFREALFYEALTWKKLNHPRLLPFLGIDREQFRSTEACYSVVVPWATHGNVRQCIEELQRSKNPVPADRWILEVAEGVAYLHKAGIAHGALRGSNILIDEHYHVKLADFGLADLVRAHTTNAVALDDPTARWTAPEVYGLDSDSEVNPQGSEEGPTFAGDIYSFACVCVEIYSNDAPQFAGVKASFRGTSRKVENAVIRGDRPLRPAALTSDELWSLIERCWSPLPGDRPGVGEVVQKLTALFPHLSSTSAI